MSSQGWIKIHRQIIEWEWYDEPNTFRLFFHLLLKANHKPKKYRGAVIKTGQVMTGQELLAKELGLTRSKIRLSLNNLKITNEITIKSNSQGTIIEVVKYKDYQITTNETAIKQPKSDQQTTTNKNEDNEKNEDKRMIPSFDDFKEYALTKKPKVNLTDLKLKYDSWIENDWCDGYDNKIKNWKSKILNTLKYIAEEDKTVNNNPVVKREDFWT